MQKQTKAATSLTSAPKSPTPNEDVRPVHQTTVSSVQQHRSGGSIAVPCIRIIGKWLIAANFNKGDKITIVVSAGELNLKRQD
jgi:hypothetical protein